MNYESFYSFLLGRLQVAMLSERINRMAAHLAANGGDADCKRRLTMATVARRKVLSYMQRRDYSGYRLAIQELGLRPLPIFHSAYLPKVRGHLPTIEASFFLASSRYARAHPPA